MTNQNLVAPIIPAYEFSLLVLKGEDQGAVYRLIGQKINIGRGQENDIQFPKDLKVSRQHARIEFSHEGVFIENTSGANFLIVDQVEVQRARLKHNSTIVLGQTELQLKIKEPQELNLTSPPTAPSHPSSPNPASSTGSPFQMPTSRNEVNFKSASSKKSRSNNSIRFVIVGLIFLFLYMFLFSPSKKGKTVDIRTDEAVQAEIEKATKLKEAAIAQRQSQGKNSRQYDDAQATYLQGFRDYKQGNFGRALGLFQACLSLFPEHVLCNRYLRLAQRRHNELIQYHMILGRKYREQGQYSACRSSFRNVMVMVGDVTSAIYKEAKANFEACDTFVEERF
ncbi:MAG: FHA domain-containing protein [Bdellovibrionales bacterium]|nr:FHA domain-containing protein [Bdellovibrionales bacterium]